jgi:hypothetical protein
MMNRYEYNFDEKGQLTVNVPNEAYDLAMRETRLPEIIEHEAQLVRAETKKREVVLILDKTWFNAEEREVHESEAAASQWLYALTATRRRVSDDLVDPDLDVHMMQDSNGDRSGQDRLAFHAELAWPLQDYEKAQATATKTMQEMARTFGYLSESIIDAAFASVRREDGMQLQALDIACACVSTDGISYDQDSKRIELFGHNLYNRQLMLTCFSGLVAVARSK